MPKMMTVEDAATALHLTAQTVWRYVRDGKLPASKIGRRYLIPEEAIEAMLEPKRAPQPSGEAPA